MSKFLTLSNDTELRYELPDGITSMDDLFNCIGRQMLSRSGILKRQEGTSESLFFNIDHNIFYNKDTSTFHALGDDEFEHPIQVSDDVRASDRWCMVYLGGDILPSRRIPTELYVITKNRKNQEFLNNIESYLSDLMLRHLCSEVIKLSDYREGRIEHRSRFVTVRLAITQNESWSYRIGYLVGLIDKNATGVLPGIRVNGLQLRQVRDVSYLFDRVVTHDTRPFNMRYLQYAGQFVKYDPVTRKILEDQGTNIWHESLFEPVVVEGEDADE